MNELVGLLEQPPSLVSYHLRQLAGYDLVRLRRSAADARDTYYSLNFTVLRRMLADTGASLHPGLSEGEELDGEVLSKLPKGLRVLFLCTHNSARSQMAEGLLRSMGSGRIEAFSAGTEVTRVHPLAIAAMAEEGIDISDQRSKHLDEYRGDRFDYVITVCDRASESCPVFPGAPERIHWSIPDPSGTAGPEKRRLKAFRDARGDLRARIRYLLILIARSRPSTS